MNAFLKAKRFRSLQVLSKLKEIGRGWVNYFRMASIHGKLNDMKSFNINTTGPRFFIAQSV